MANNSNENRYKKMKWIVDDDYVIFGPRREYALKSLKIIALSIMIVAFVLIVLIGSETIKIEALSSTFIMIVLFMAFLYGIQLNGVSREAKEVMEERDEDIRKAIAYYEKGRK